VLPKPAETNRNTLASVLLDGPDFFAHAHWMW